MFNVSSAQMYAWIAEFFWPFFRILALIMSAPLFGATGVSASTKIGIAIVLTIIIAPILPAMPDIQPASAQGMLIMAQQLLIGFALGFAIRLVFTAMEMAGHIAGLQMGLGFASFFDPQNSTQVPLMGQFIGVMTMLLFVTLNGHLMMIATLVESFHTLPIGSSMAGQSLYALVDTGKNVFSWGVQMSLPVIAALTLVNVGLGVLTRAAPQLNIFAVGFPLTLGAGFLILAISVPYFLPLFNGMMEESIDTMLRLAQPAPVTSVVH
ncbi:MAG TPA: flagellar biosynthetic protein FliR [Methylophilaceae bacterium]|jgi:flagellar biosynthetic protein FliR